MFVATGRTAVPIRRASSRAGRSRRRPGSSTAPARRNYGINAGGDIVARGEAAPGQPWRVGIRHPDRRDRVAAVLAVADRAVATSGSYERGDHILDPRSVGGTVDGLRSVTVVGPALAFTDAYATALFVMGLDGLRWLSAHPDYAAYAIGTDGRAVWTQGMERYLVRED